MNENILVVIPAYQEGRNIEELVRRVQTQVSNVLVIDDGSSDDTAERAKQAGAQVIRNTVNQGKGQSIKTGLAKALELNCEAVILMDGDLQHLPEEISLFLDLWKKEHPDLVVGARKISFDAMPFVRKVTNQFMSFLIGRACSQQLPDSQCGYRLLSRRILNTIVKNCLASKYDFETEMLIVASRHGFEISSVPVTTVYRDGVSKIRPFVDTLRFIRLMLRYGMCRDKSERKLEKF